MRMAMSADDPTWNKSPRRIPPTPGVGLGGVLDKKYIFILAGVLSSFGV
jgi:hypothetical protein